MNLPIRLRGLIMALVGFGAAAAIVQLLGGRQYTPWLVGGLGALGLEGVLELVSGYPFHKIAQKWDSMPGLIRFGLGLVIIAAAVACLIFAMMPDARTWLLGEI